MRYARDGNGHTGPVPEHVIQAYMKMLRRGLFSEA